LQSLMAMNSIRSFRNPLLALLLTCCILLGAAQQGQFVTPDQDYSLEWEVSGNTITFTMSAVTNGWVGVAFSSEASGASGHLNSDSIVGWVEDNAAANVVLIDGFSLNSQTRPDQDVIQNVQMVPAQTSQDQGITSITFTRQLNTGDNLDQILSSGPVNVYYSYGSADGTSPTNYPIHASRGPMGQIDFLGGNQLAPPNNLPPTPPINPGEVTTGSYLSPNGDFRVNWEANVAANQISFTLMGQTTGWLAVGWSSNPNGHLMTDSVVGWIDTVQDPANPQLVLVDGFSTGPQRTRPVTDMQNNLIPGEFEEDPVAGTTMISFTRPLSADGNGEDLAISGLPMNLVWAYGQQDGDRFQRFTQHSPLNRGVVPNTQFLAQQAQQAGPLVGQAPQQAAVANDEEEEDGGLGTGSILAIAIPVGVVGLLALVVVGKVASNRRRDRANAARFANFGAPEFSRAGFDQPVGPPSPVTAQPDNGPIYTEVNGGELAGPPPPPTPYPGALV
jgi:hypothetical protein